MLGVLQGAQQLAKLRVPLSLSLHQCSLDIVAGLIVLKGALRPLGKKRVGEQELFRHSFLSSASVFSEPL